MKSNEYDLTHPQNRIFLQSNLKPFGNWDLIVFFVKFHCDIQIDLLSKALNIAVKENQALRTKIITQTKSGKPAQFFE